ncbi:MAG TPA: c-type cytochrome [Steroidobacteraceae bacterium]|nr:c-type cytochrome [Steroidobacteraceae bacterium]HQX46912.1 c-type cytochrome [Steroidobacteraceae bacterium]HQX78478.1 c-type cytochrome [Steroidobacteraceae bacterium]HQZ79039.1 c-type cytochrome [Steroidobacteraceae bacterium]
MAMTGNRFLLSFAVSLIIVIAALAAFAWSGAYGIGADEPHSRPVSALLASVRDRAVRARAAKLVVPADLSSEARIRQGAGNYDAMCATCHLSPGSSGSELNRGLYPAPPRLDAVKVDAAQAFWVVKHGIKASGMPAWGKSMSDEYIWNMVAFVGALPGLDAGRYRTLVAESGGHSHDGEDADDHGDHDHRKPDQHDGAEHPDVPEAARGAVAVVDAFGAALVAGELGKAKLLLDPGVIVLEAGGAQRSREEYMGEHAVADARFLHGAHVQVTRRIARAEGDMAWVASESTIHAHGDKPASLLATETMVLARKGNAWRIVQIHWSSQEK